ncbi:acetyl-CoA synthetase-like protein [Aspergillus niger]|uniref:acetyl-CoA synthetase-like protein n=1 Tax=Aspergillus lacticoffeatus (strain CBS 101883) TaxID=1450533 RepID=UPI000D7F4EAB|nr:acetyl-CoA synthetase-like protein [Aspergillus niger CBS 101883]PYH51726.1 acetyl-CoA synthetase-like protein [Aspergillus niger CBS 101883]GJP89751.1 acetyl-CoA synthetase-like protein [Aspergillus niger]
MDLRTGYMFPCLTDGQFVEDDTLHSVALGIDSPISLSNGPDGEWARELSIAWAILLFTYNEQEAVEFACLRNQHWFCVDAKMNRDLSWKDIEIHEGGTSDGRQVNTGLCLSQEGATPIPTRLQLVLVGSISGGGLSLEYRPNLLSAEQAANVASTLETIMRALQGRTVSIGSIDVLSERNITDLNRFAVARRALPEGCLDDIITAQAVERGNSIAIDSWDGTLSYQELDTLSTLLAKYLRSLDLSGTYVPLCADKSAWAVVAMLAILKAGAACSPLDPSHPRSRLQSMVQLCDAKAVIATERHASLLQMDGVEVVVVGPDMSSFLQHQISPAEAPGPSHRDVAFLMWTSGSTGAPKGVILEHTALFMSISAYAAANQFSAETRCFQFTSFTFAVSLCDIFGTLSQGGCLCMPSETQRLTDLTGALRELHATFCWLTSTSLADLNPHDLPDLRSVTVGGESLSRELVARWATHLRLTVSYGTTETAGWCLLNTGLSPTGDARTLGRPTIPGVWIAHPDNVNRLVPVGAVGELLVEGPFLAQGYLDDEERTAAHFIPPPSWMTQFRPQEVTRLYRTNDLVRYNSDGSVSFVGRRQAHAKIRGNRISLPEIEAQVRHSCKDAQAVVELVTTKDQVEMLTAFLVVSGQESLSEAPLICPPNDCFRETVTNSLSVLEQSLPSYMVPTVFVPLSHIPLTRTNKADRHVLRKLAEAMSRADLVQLMTKPRPVEQLPLSPLERQIQGLWADLTNIPAESIGPDDNFFHLGGDSVLAIHLVPLARRHGLSLTVQDVFRYPKMKELGAHLEQEASQGSQRSKSQPIASFDPTPWKSVAAQQCGIDELAIEDVYPCTALQEGLMALSAQRTGAYILSMAQNLSPTVDLGRLLEAWQTVVKAVPILRTRIVRLTNEGFHQAVVDESIEWQSVKSEAEFRRMNQLNPLGLGTRLVRFALLLSAADQPSRLLLAMHHSVFDRWSGPLLVRAVEDAYQGQPVMPQYFKDFVSYVSTCPREEVDAFWRHQLSDADPTVFPPTPEPNYLPSPTKSSERIILLPLSRTHVTITTKLRLCWALVLSQHTGNADVVFGAVSTGRSARVEGIESLIGPTLATVPFRVRIDGSAMVSDALQALQDDAATMLPYEQRGLQNIARISRETRAACNFQNLLIVHAPDSRGHSTILKITDDQQLLDLFSYGLTLSCEVLDQDRIQCQAFFDPNMLEHAYVKVLLDQLAHAVRQIHAVPDCKVGEISLLSPQDQQQLQEWNPPIPRTGLTIHETIQRQCLAHPQKEAVCSWDGSITYRALNELSSSLASQILQRCGQPTSFVPLLMERSKWTAVTMLAVMKAGKAFVLLDASFPVERLQSICCQLDATLILSSSKHADVAQRLVSNPLIVDAIIGLPGPSLALPVVHPDATLYAVFTSGSTGRPKAVLISHASYGSGAEAHIPAALITPATRVLQFASYAFDASIIEHLSTFMAGGCVCVLSDPERTSSLAEAVAARRANFAWLTPSVTRFIDPQDFPTMDRLCLMGESMRRSEIERWSSRVNLMQAYGPAECSVLATLRPSLTTQSDPRNIGCARGCHAWVVDPENHTRLLPIGAVGELIIEGPIVGQGYHGSPEQTQAAFPPVPDWLSDYHDGDLSQVRVYKTGDLVQYSPKLDGSLLFIGRKDRQVKLRGQRLELSEVEYHAYHTLAGTWELVVELINSQHNPALALFLAEKQDSPKPCGVLSMTPAWRSVMSRLRDTLASRLPPYMVPTVWIPITQIPLSSSQKTDRRSLQSLAGDLSAEQYQTYILASSSEATPGLTHSHLKEVPLNENELVLQDLVRQVFTGEDGSLSVASIPMDGLFTDIGGDSLGALALTSLAKQHGFHFTAGDVLGSSLGELASLRHT